MNKADLRKSLRARLLALPGETRRLASVQICGKLVAQSAFRAAETVLLFAPQPVEPDIDLLWDFAEFRAKRLVYPRMNGRSLDLYAVRDPAELERSRWGLREPVADPERHLPPGRVDFAVVPGVAFSHRRERLGRGGGFYDRLLATEPGAFKVGVCFDFQLFAELPVESHDIRMDAVVTHDSPLP